MSDINDVFGNEESGFEAVFGGEFPTNIDYETDVNNKPSIGGEEVSGSHTIDYYGGVTSTEMETALETKADISDLPDMTDYYTKNQVDSALSGKADVSDLPDMSDYYTKNQVDSALSSKANVSDLPDMSSYYTKTEVDTALGAKANSSDVYTKAQIDTMLIMDVTNTIFGGE